MTTGALAGYLTQLKRGDAATPENFTLIAEAGDIAGPELKTTMSDVTSHSSAGFLEQIPTIKQVGQIKFPVNFVPTNSTHSYAAGLVKDWNNETRRNFQMVWPDGTIWSFAAFVSGVAFKAPVKGPFTADVTVDVTGAPTLA
jgi:hypothetical protein